MTAVSYIWSRSVLAYGPAGVFRVHQARTQSQIAALLADEPNGDYLLPTRTLAAIQMDSLESCMAAPREHQLTVENVKV